MESATLDPKLFEQRIKFPLPNEIRVPRRSVASGKKQSEPVRSPGAKESAKMLPELRRNFAETIALFRLHRFDLPVPNLLIDFDRSRVEQQVSRRQATGFATPDPGLGEDPVVRFVRLRRTVDDHSHLVQCEASLVDKVRIRTAHKCAGLFPPRGGRRGPQQLEGDGRNLASKRCSARNGVWQSSNRETGCRGRADIESGTRCQNACRFSTGAER